MQDQTSSSFPIRWVAHRGYSSRYIENTLQAMQMAIAKGACYLETDIQFSADREPMLFHDESLHRLCQIEGRVQDYSSKDLTQLKLSLAGRPTVAGMAHLTGLLDILEAHSEVQLFLEIKQESVGYHGVGACLPKLFRLIENYSNQIVVISFSIEILSYMQKLGYPRLAPVIRNLEQLSTLEVRALSAELVFINHHAINDWLQVKSSQIPIAVYEISSKGLADLLWAKGLAFIETDAIGEMISSCR